MIDLINFGYFFVCAFDKNIESIELNLNKTRHLYTTYNLLNIIYSL
jgi:hypothetical protein